MAYLSRIFSFGLTAPTEIKLSLTLLCAELCQGRVLLKVTLHMFLQASEVRGEVAVL